MSIYYDRSTYHAIGLPISSLCPSGYISQWIMIDIHIVTSVLIITCANEKIIHATCLLYWLDLTSHAVRLK